MATRSPRTVAHRARNPKSLGLVEVAARRKSSRPQKHLVESAGPAVGQVRSAIVRASAWSFVFAYWRTALTMAAVSAGPSTWPPK